MWKTHASMQSIPPPPSWKPASGRASRVWKLETLQKMCVLRGINLDLNLQSNIFPPAPKSNNTNNTHNTSPVKPFWKNYCFTRLFTTQTLLLNNASFVSHHPRKQRVCFKGSAKPSPEIRNIAGWVGQVPRWRCAVESSGATAGLPPSPGPPAAARCRFAAWRSSTACWRRPGCWPLAASGGTGTQSGRTRGMRPQGDLAISISMSICLYLCIIFIFIFIQVFQFLHLFLLLK